MPYVFAKTLCLWHLPKTGGTWAQRAIENAGIETQWHHPQHGTWRSFEELLHVPYHAMILRRPFDWYWSLWRYLLKNNDTDPLWNRIKPSIIELKDFPKFCCGRIGLYSRMIRDMRLPCFMVWRTETLNTDVAVATSVLLGADFDKITQYPRQNVGDDVEHGMDADFKRLIDQSEPDYAC
jgi:hypothetical protein